MSRQVESDPIHAVNAETPVATGAPETTRALPVRAPVSLRNKNLIVAGDSNDQRFFQALCRTGEPGAAGAGFGVLMEHQQLVAISVGLPMDWAFF